MRLVWSVWSVSFQMILFGAHWPVARQDLTSAEQCGWLLCALLHTVFVDPRRVSDTGNSDLCVLWCANTDTEFWAAISLFVDKFSAAQRALIADRKALEEREARKKWVMSCVLQSLSVQQQQQSPNVFC